jgi:hypothetical protein
LRIALVSLMRIAIVLLICAAMLPLMLPLAAQEKPRVFITPNATRRTQGYKSPSYEERTTTIEERTVEISRDFSESCKEVTVSAERRKADYIVRLNRKIGRSQIAVYRTNGDLVGVADNSSIKGSVKGACELIKRDLPQTAAKTQDKPDPAHAK